MVKLLMKEGASVQTREIMYKVVIQMLFLYGSEIWVMTGDMLTVLEGFYNPVARIVREKTIQRDGGGRW